MGYILIIQNNVFCLLKFVWSRSESLCSGIGSKLIELTFLKPQYLYSIKLTPLMLCHYGLGRPVSEILGLRTTSKNRALENSLLRERMKTCYGVLSAE